MFGNFDKSVANGSGGFLNDSRSSNEQRKENVKSAQTIVPVMIRHLLLSGKNMQMWGTTVRLITFIGIVRYVDETTTKIIYEIEDETGTITAVYWLPEKPIYKLNTYVRIYGHLREEKEKKHVLALKIFPVTDLNEITNHLLEVVHSLLKFKSNVNTQDESSITTSQVVPTTGDNIGGLTKEQTIIFKIIRAENNTANGIDRSLVQARCPRTILPDLNNIIDFLISEGHIYTTVTEDKFKAT